jgi:hypothetical protein
MYLKRKQVAQYPELALEKMFRDKISSAISRTADKLALKGDTTAVGATNVLSITNGLEILSNVTHASNAPVEYSNSNSTSVLDALAEAQEDIGVYGSDEEIENLVIFASSSFVKAAKTAASKDYVGYEIMDVPALGLKQVVHLHGIPVIRRLNLTGEKAILCNTKGMFVGYYGDIAVDVEHKAGRRADLLVMTYWFDFKWAFLNSSSKSEGLITIQKASS